MLETERMDSGAREYYNTLPPLIREQALKSSTQLRSKRDLQDFYRDILRSGPETVKPDAVI